MALTQKIRTSFLSYFSKLNHTIMPSKPLTAKNDDSLFFVNSGMVPFKSWFLNPSQAKYSKICSIQKCLRISGKDNDIEHVGKNNEHLTFFEMLGNFSFGDYYKEESITYCWNYLIKELELPKSRLRVSVLDKDIETANLWKSITGLSKNCIMYVENNYWSLDQNILSGPCTEIFYNISDNKWIELWNIVFLHNARNNKNSDVSSQLCVDTGMGLERLVSILLHDSSKPFSLFNSDLLQKLFLSCWKSLDLPYDIDISTLYIIVDHIRSIGFLLAEGIIPSSTGKGYILRKIIRRSINNGKILQISQPFLYKLLPLLNEIMSDNYPELNVDVSKKMNIIENEENLYLNLLNKNIEIFLKNLHKPKLTTITGNISSNTKLCFKFYESYGIPLEISQAILSQHGLSLNEIELNELLDQHKTQSRFQK